MVFKALMGGGSRDDLSSRGSVRRKSSTTGGGDSGRTSSSRRQSKISSASSVSSSRRSTRGDDRDRGLGDISASRSVTGDSTTTYVTAEPASYVDEPLIIERTPRSDRDDRQRSSRDSGDRDSRRKSEKRYSEDRSSRDGTSGRERTRPRAQSGDTAAHFAAEIANPGFNQFPMQYDSSNIPGTSAPYHPPLDSHITQQFPGQLPNTTTQPYMPPNPAGFAADYYNDQGQSVAHQPGVRPQAPDIIIGAEPHLQAASPMANPPPEPSSLGQVGAAAEYYAGGDSFATSSTPASKPPKPSKPSKPSSSRPPKPMSGSSVAAESATFGIGSELMNQASANYPTTSGGQSRPPMQATGGSSSSHNGVGLALGGAAAGAAAAYMINHHSEQSNSNAQYNNHHNESYGIGIPTNGNFQQSSYQGNPSPYVQPVYANRPPSGPSYPSGGMQPGSLAYHQKHHGPLAAFVDFWRDPEGVGKFEDYTEAIGVCKYCFEPGTSSLNAPRKHHYDRRRRSPVVDRYGSSSRVDKLTRYNSSEDESRRKKSKGSSWLAGGLAGGLAGYVAKSLFSSKDFEDTYSVRSGTRVESSRRHTYDDESMVSSSKASSTSRGVISKKRSSDDKHSASRESKSYRYSRRSSRSRSRSTSRDRRTSSGLKEAAIGAAVGTALTAAATRSSERNRSQDRSTQRHRRRQSDSSGSVNFERSRRRGRSSPRGFKSFFTAPSANRRKKSSKKERGFFSFGNSSSSSGDFDLAFGGSELFGSTVSGRSSRSSKSSRKQNVDAEILGLGIAARQLAHSSSRKELTPRDLARPPNYGRPSKVEDGEWEDAESSDSTISTNLAYGGSAIFGSSESVTSGTSFWPWSSSSRKQKKAQRQNSQPPPTNDYPYYPNDYASQDGSSGRGSLQQLVPIPTSDPTRFDVVRMSTSSSPNVQPPLVRPGPIPLQQPQPFTPVSQSVYYPTVTAPIDPLVQRIDLEDNSSRDIRRQRRSNSSPVLPMVPLDEPSPGILKRRSTAKDAGTVSFSLTEEQTDRQQEVDRRDKERLERRRKQDFAVLREEADELAELERRRLDRERRREERRRREEAEAEEAAREARRERRRKEAKIDDRPSVLSNGERSEIMENVTRKTDERKEPSSSSWVTPAIVGAGAAVVSAALAEKAFEDDRSSATTSRHEERREKRRSERRSASESQSEVTEVPFQVPTQPVVEEDDDHKEKEQRIARIAASRIIQNQSPTAHESYEDFFTPDDIRHHDDHEDSSPNIIEVVPRSERRIEPYLGSDLDKPDPSWPPLVINIIKPTPPGSYDGSVRDAHSPVPTTPEPIEKEEPEEEPKEEEVEPTPVRPTTGSRVSWGEHQFHEYEVETPLSDREEHIEESDHHEATASPEFHEIEKNYEAVAEEKLVSREVEETESDSKHSMPGSFDDDVEFAATLAAGAEIAGFDPTVVTDDASYYGKDHLSKFKDSYRPPAVESVTDLGDAVSVQSGSARKEYRAPESFDFEDVHTDEQTPSKTNKNGQAGTRSIAVTEPEDVTMSEILDRKSTKELRDDTGDSVPSSPVREESKKSKKKKRRSRTLDDLEIESEERSSRRSASRDYSDSKRQEKSDDVDFEPTLKRVESAPVTDDWIEEDKERRHRRSKHSSSDRTESLDGARSVAASAPGADELEEYRSRRSSRRSKDDDGDLEDDSRSLPDVDDDGEKRRRRKHKRHSGNFDDAASVVSSPAKIDETREKRRSRESSTASTQRSKEPEKKSGGLFSSIFGSKTNLERSSSTSGKRETQSEIGVDYSTSERRRKKKSSSRRSLSGDGLDGWDAASEAAQSSTDLSQLGKALEREDGDNDSQSSHRKRREQRRRDKYEEIVDSARDASEKDRFSTADDNDDDRKSFLGMRPEMPPVNSYEEDSTRDLVGGASGLAIATGALGLGSMSIEDQLQDVNQRLRSRSVSPSMAEKTFELAPRSQSRPSSPGGSNQEEKELRARRLSLLRTSDSPTAVPLHFKKPPTSPNSSRRVSMVSPAQSPSSPRPGHRRPNSVEFKNVREIRPLWLVERHSTSKLDVEPEGPLPSLPSSKTSSRSPSVENLREGFDDGEDAVTGFFMGSGNSAYSWGRKPVDLSISTDQLPAEEDDFLNSQQATPTAETYTNKDKQFGPPPIKKEKPKYEFHSPSELLQDPTTYQSMVPELPESLDRLPSVAGSELGGKESEMRVEEAPVVESAREVDVKDEGRLKEQKSGLSSFLAGAGFASVVDAAVSAAVSDHEATAKDVNEHEATSKEFIEDTIRGQASTSSKPQSFGGFGNVVDAAVSAAVSGHASHDVVDADRDQSMKADENMEREHTHSPNAGLFAGIVDTAVAAAADETHPEVSQLDLSKDIDLQAAAQEQKAEEIPPTEPSVEEESKAVTDTEASSGTSKKQKRKDKKKKKKSKDLDAPAEDNDETETTTAAVPVVELDSSVPEPVPEAEAERAAEPVNETSTVAEQQPVSEEVEVKDNTPEISIDQPVVGESPKVAEDITREIEAPTPNVETEAVTASAENEQTTAGTNDQSPHVAAEPEDEGSSSVAATGSKSSKKKQKNKKKSLSLSETPVALSDEPQIDPSVTVTEEPKSIDEVVEEKPVLEETSASMLSETLKTTEEVATSEKQQDTIEPEVSESVAKPAADEGDYVRVEQDAQVTPGTDISKSIDSPVDEWFDSAETAEVQPTEPVEIAPGATDREIQTPEVSQDTTAIAEPVETKQTEEEPVTTSSSKKKNKKKKKKGQSLSIDESAPQETTEESSETMQPQAESAEAPSLESKVVQTGDSEGQSREVEEVLPESSESLPVEVEASAPRTDDASIPVVPESEPTSEVSEAVIESEPAPEQIEEVVEPQTSDAPVEPVATETLQSDADVISPEQLSKEIEAAEATPTQEAFEEVPSTPSKSKKKKGKKGKRVSWAEGADFAVESEPATPAEPETPALEETAPALPSEEPLPATEGEAVLPASAEPESSTVSEVEVPREVEADVPIAEETVDSATPSSVDADSALTSEPSSTAEVAEEERSTGPQLEQPLEDQPISLPSESSQSNETKELPEEEAEQSEGASSKSKKKKDKKKDKKKKKAAEASALADEEPSQLSEPAVDEATKEAVEDIAPGVSEPIETTPAGQPATEEQTADVVPAETAESQTPEVSEPIESTPVEQPAAEQETTDIVPADTPKPASPETLEPTESIPVDQSTAEEQTSAPLPGDAPEPSAPEVSADEPKSTDIAQEEEEPRETSKSKKKKDKKKKKAAAAAAAALTSEQDSSEVPVTEEAEEIAETVDSDNAEKAEDAVVEQPRSDDAKEVAVEEPVAEPQTLEEPVEKSAEEPVQESVQEPIPEPAQETVQESLEVPVEESVQEPAPEPVKETKPADPTDDVPTQETSKSKKKKDKKKKKAAEALLLDEEPALKEGPADSTPATPAEAPEQTESISQEQQSPEGEKTQDVIAAEIEEPQPVEIPKEEVKTPEVAADDESPQETSKSKKKKDKKKKKAAAALSLDEEATLSEPTPSEPIVEETEGKPAEAEASEPQEQAILDEATKEITEDQTAEPQIAEPLTEEVKPVDNTEDDGPAQATSKSKKKKDKKKKKAAEALPWDDEPQTPVKDEVIEPVESAVPETQELPAVEEQKAEDVPKDKDVELESTEPPADVAPTESQELPAAEESKLDDAPNDKDVVPEPTETPTEDANAVPVAAENEWAQETSSKSKKKKDKKKKKAAEALPWDEEPTPSDKPTDEQPPADTEPSASQPQDVTVDDKKLDDITEALDIETLVPETPAEETKQVDTPEEDSRSQETSKSKKKKDKKKRKSLQLEAAQEESTPDIAAEETTDVPETIPAVEPTPATEDVAAAVDEQKEVDTQSQPVLQEEAAPVQAESIEDEGSSSKSGKSKKKKNKNKSKDEPMPWDEEPSVKTPDVQQETIAEPGAIEDVPNEESTRELETPATIESTEQEKLESEQIAEVLAEGEELPVTTQAETSEPTELPQAEESQLPADGSVTVQPEESTNQDSLNTTTVAEPQPADITETIEHGLADVPTSAITEGATVNDNEPSQSKSGKKSKKKKKRDSMPWDDESAEQQASSTSPVAVEGGEEASLKDSQSEEKQPEPAPTEELQSQQEPVITESKDLDSVDANVEAENEDSAAAVTEPTRQLSAKEKRKEKKKQKRRTLDLADEPSPTVADDTPEVTAPVEPPKPDEQPKDDTEAADDFAPVGKKKGKKNKRQSVSWEEEVIQAVAEEEPKPNETEQATEESDSKIPPLSEDLDSGPSQTENELQETPVEVEGKETFQSSEETHTDQKEKDFDWTDNVVSPQVQSQTEESPFPVRSPISDERDDPDQSRPTTTTVDDSQSHETGIPEAVAEDQPLAAVQQEEGPTELATADAQPVDHEAEDIDWTASKSSKKNKKRKKQKSITTVPPEESMIIEEESPSKTTVEQDDKPDIEPQAVDTDESREAQEEPAVVEDSSLVTESVPLQAIDTEQQKEIQEPAVVENSPLLPESVPLQTVDTEQPREIQEEPAPVEEVLVSEPAPAMEANPDEEFKPAGSSKKKGKKNKKKANAWSFEELGEEPVGDQNTEQAPIQPPGDEVREEIVAVDNDKTEVPEEAPLAPEPVQEEVVENTTTKDATVIPEEMPEEKSVPQEELPETETAPISEPPSRKLSKKEKRKMKKGKKIDFEEEEPVTETVEKEQAEVVSSEQVPEAAEEKIVSEAVIDDTPVLDEKPVETEPVVGEVPITTKEQQVTDVKSADTELVLEESPIIAQEQQVADANPVDIEPIPEEVPIVIEEQPAKIADTKLAEPVVEEYSTPIEEQQVADVKPAEPVLEEAPISTEEQVAEKELEIAPVQEEPIMRKLSKKEKRKNKKLMTDNWPEEEPLAASRDITPQPDVVEPVAAEESEKNFGNDVAVEESTGVEPEHAHVSLDPFDVPDADEEGPNEPPADFAIDTNITERDSEPKLDADAALHARQLEQEADLAVAASLFGDSAEPEPEQIVSRQSSKKQKGKKGKKDKKNAQLEKEVLKDTAPASQIETIPKEEVVHEERHDTKPSESVEEMTRSWPSVQFDNDLSRTYSRDKNGPNELEPERPIEISAQDTASMIDEFRTEETHEESTRSLSDQQVVDVEKASQQGHRSHSPSQKEDVDMIISATMAAAGFFPSTVTAPAKPKAITDIQSTSGTSRDLSDVYEHRDVFSDKHSKSSITTSDAPKGESRSNKLADIFPGLERVKYRKPSPKSHEKQTTSIVAVEERSLPTVTPVKSLKKTQSTHHLSSRELPVTVESTSKDRSSSLLFDSSPSTRLEPTPDTTRRTSSSPIRLQHQTSSGSLHRTKSIHGHHTGAARSWQLEEELTPTKRTSSQSPQPLLRSDNLEGLSPPRTPLDPIKEHDGPRLPSPSPRLVMGEGPYKLERPDSRSSVRSSRSLRKANRSISGDLRAVAAASQAKEQQSNPDWPSADGHKKGKAGRQDVGHLPQPLNQPDSFHDDLLHDNNHHVHDDYDRRHLENIPSSSSYDPVTDKGKRPVRGMSDVYEGWGETPNSPRSPTRPPSVRRRQSMQHLQELETRLDQLISENRLLAAAKDEAEQRLSRVGIARRKSDQALNTSNADLRDKEAEIARLTRSLEWMQSEVQRLTSENEAVNAKHAELTASHAREVDGLRTRQLELASGMEGIVREQISAALAEKDAELRRLRDELAAARQAVQELQQQIVAATADDVLSIHDEDYFDNACQRLCQHVQQWVLRFSKHSDLRRCRPLSEVRDTKVADRFDNAILDGTDIDVILADRVRRRDVFVAVVMAMIWEYVFTRYLFGMDRDQRQKLKALEKQLSEIGPRRAVAHWRALTLTLLAKRPSFADQRVRDTEAVALEIMETLSQLLPPPQSAQSQLLESLRGVLRRAANLSIEMRTQRAEYVMLPPLQPEYDSQGDLARQVSFNASLMNERSGMYNSNETLESQGTPVRLVLFPLVVKKGNDLGDGDEEIVVCPAQVLVAWPENEKPRDRMSALGNRSVSSVVPSVDMGNMI